MRKFFLLTTLTLIMSASPSWGVQVAEDNMKSIEAAAAVRFSEELIRVAHMVSMSEPLDTKAISAAVALITVAAKLTPNDASVWRAMVEVAQMADRYELRSWAIKELLRVTPNETSSQLARLRDVIEGTNTAEQRMRVYEQIFSGDLGTALDPRVASRIAFDAAMLQRQLGNISQFARWLAESVALDPSNPDAISLAAGFFGDESADTYRRAELLASAVLSNIRDVTTQVALAEFLMSYGDYKDARMLYDVVLGDDVENISVISNGLLADIALCQWAAGDTVAAMNTILERQKVVDERNRKMAREAQPRLTPLELADIHAPLVPKLATVRAAIYAEQAYSSQAAIALDNTLVSMTTLSRVYENQGGEAIVGAIELYLQAAWVSLWLGDDVEVAKIFIERAEKLAVLDPNEKQRLNGWIAFRQGDNATATALLLGLNEDPAAQAGLGMIYLSQGNKRAAANEFLTIVRSHGGTILGVWSLKKLQHIVGQEFNIRPEIEELQRLMEGVLETISTVVNDPRPAIDLRVIPTKWSFDPYEPVLINIELTNNTTVPLTIAKNGPLQPLVLIEARLEISNLSFDITPPIIIAIDREISIAPRETLTIQTNLRQQWVGGLVNSFPLRGASIQLRSSINFTAHQAQKTTGETVLVYKLGRLGLRHETDIFRMDGVRLVDSWLRDAIANAKNMTTIEDLTSLVLLTWVVGDQVIIVDEETYVPRAGRGESPSASRGRIVLQDEAITTVLTVFPRLGPYAQAWIISTMSGDPSIEAVTRMMREPENTIAQLAWILRFASTTVPDEALDDPKLLLALQSDDPTVRPIAKWVYSWVQEIVKRRYEQQLGTPTTETQ